MSRSEAYSARAGVGLLILGGLAIGRRLVGGGSANLTVAFVCLVGSLVAFVLAWRWSFTPMSPRVPTPVGGRGRLFPIADYDDLWVEEILPLLVELDDDELCDVLRYEKAREARPRVVDRIQALLARPRLRPGSRPG